jgi:hypothetical protein
VKIILILSHFVFDGHTYYSYGAHKQAPAYIHGTPIPGDPATSTESAAFTDK